MHAKILYHRTYPVVKQVLWALRSPEAGSGNQRDMEAEDCVEAIMSISKIYCSDVFREIP